MKELTLLHAASKLAHIYGGRSFWALVLHFQEVGIFIASVGDIFGVVEYIVEALLSKVVFGGIGVVDFAIIVEVYGHPFWIVDAGASVDNIKITLFS